MANNSGLCRGAARKSTLRQPSLRKSAPRIADALSGKRHERKRATPRGALGRLGVLPATFVAWRVRRAASAALALARWRCADCPGWQRFIDARAPWRWRWRNAKSCLSKEDESWWQA